MPHCTMIQWWMMVSKKRSNTDQDCHFWRHSRSISNKPIDLILVMCVRLIDMNTSQNMDTATVSNCNLNWDLMEYRSCWNEIDSHASITSQRICVVLASCSCITKFKIICTDRYLLTFGLWLLTFDFWSFDLWLLTCDHWPSVPVADIIKVEMERRENMNLRDQKKNIIIYSNLTTSWINSRSVLHQLLIIFIIYSPSNSTDDAFQTGCCEWHDLSFKFS